MWVVLRSMSVDDETPAQNWPSVDAVCRKRFSVVRRGFDQHEVCSYLALLADRIADLERQIERAAVPDSPSQEPVQ